VAEERTFDKFIILPICTRGPQENHSFYEKLTELSIDNGSGVRIFTGHAWLC
jgi:hypothetical protein